MFVVLDIGYNPSQRNYASFQYLRYPNQKTKKSAVFARFGTVFQKNGWGTAVFQDELQFQIKLNVILNLALTKSLFGTSHDKTLRFF